MKKRDLPEYRDHRKHKEGYDRSAVYWNRRHLAQRNSKALTALIRAHPARARMALLVRQGLVTQDEYWVWETERQNGGSGT